MNASVFETRAFIREHLVEHDLMGLVDDVQKVGSELAKSAALQSRIPFTVVLESFERSVRLTVSDDSPLRPVLAAATPMALRGHGLRIVESYCRDWGVCGASTNAKSIWVTFDVP